MKPIRVLLLLSGLLCLASQADAASTPPVRPNLLCIFTDDHSVRTLSCYADTPDAYRWARTPNIDRLAAQGGRFTQSYTVQFLQERAREKDKPWFFWLCFVGVHGPYTPADRHLKDYLDAPATEIAGDVFGPRPEKPDYLVNFSRWTPDAKGQPSLQGRSLDSWVKQYNQAVRALDEGVGRIVQALKDTGQLENTIVVFTADQGYARGQHGFKDKITTSTSATSTRTTSRNSTTWPATRSNSAISRCAGSTTPCSPACGRNSSVPLRQKGRPL